MDEKVAKWILEFLLRKPIDEKIINGVLSCLPLSNNDNRLKKTILLRKIESEALNGSVSEKLLELLEIVEELNHGAGKTASDLMKKAYCAVAVDCTVRFLEENVEENGKYFEAVERVWRNRVCKMEGLVSEESDRWLGDIEAAVWDSGVCEKILMRNTRNEALKAVKGCLKEAWESMGPTFLELVALKVGNQVEELGRVEDGGGGGGVLVGSDNPCRVLVASQGMGKGQVVVRRKHVAVKTRCPRGIKISDANEEAETSLINPNEEAETSLINDVPTREMDKVQEALQSSSIQLHAAVSDSHRGASHTAHNFSSTKDNDSPIHKMDKVQEALQSNSLQLHAAVSDSHLDPSRAVHNLSFTKATDNMSNVNAIEKQTGPTVIHATSEVRRVQEALKSSVRELHAVVTDPLPEALEIANTLSSTGATGNHDTNHTTAVENHNMSNNDVLQNQIQPVIHAPRESTQKNTENVEKKDKLTRDAQVNETHDPKEQHKRKRSLMEPNGTSHTFEWDNSIDNVSRGGLHLPPSPKRSRVPPLEQYVDKAKAPAVKERRKWTPQEEDTLRDAVKRLGRNWKLILECNYETFKDRSNVDLKDKWRNMLKSQS